MTSSTDPDGQTITYAYNTNGQLTAENLPDGTSDTYTYDSHGNMLTADGPGGDWSFTYNSQNLPTTIVEPYGTLTVQYGIDGNITQIVDQTGFTVNYDYDAVGRLSELTDAQRQPDRVVHLRPGRERHQRDQGQRHEHDLPIQRRRRRSPRSRTSRPAARSTRK